IAEGMKANGANVVYKGKQLARIGFETLGKGLSQFPFLLILEQSKTERFLGEYLTKHNHSVEWYTQLEGFTQDADAVHAMLKHKDGKMEKLQVDYLVGADGAKSVVRHTLNLPLAGGTYKQYFFFLDCKV